MAKGRRLSGKGNKSDSDMADAGQEDIESPKDTAVGVSDPLKESAGEEAAEKEATANANGVPDTEGETKGNKGKYGRQRKGRRKGRKMRRHKRLVEPERNVELAGLIFMCSSDTKKDCYKYRVFGLPEAKKDVVEKVTKGMKLFLFDLNQKLLYGIYKASSAGGMNLEQEAFKDSERKFPAQVRFRIHKDCLPVPESEFKEAITENYFARNRFSSELSSDQVSKLLQLFRPLDEKGLPKPKPGIDGRKEAALKSRNPRGAPPARGPPARGPPARGPPARGRSSWASAPQYPREPAYPPLYGRDTLSSELELRRLEQLRGGVTAPQDLYQAGLTSHLISNPDIELLEAESLYRQRLQLRQMQEARADALERRAYHVDPLLDTSIRQAGIASDLSRKRSLDDILLEERSLAAKRPLLQDDLLRSTGYQRELPVGSYLDGLHSSSASLPYGSISSQSSWLY